jgi:hypothetical protein
LALEELDPERHWKLDRAHLGHHERRAVPPARRPHRDARQLA